MTEGVSWLKDVVVQSTYNMDNWGYSKVSPPLNWSYTGLTIDLLNAENMVAIQCGCL
jgi:hypothetical protein